ncbi:hypothetical protein QFC24_007045 [Naganishia onofrii]|uniref:Uncharacterized protein n=1 Tax=Naganishia onofrii TaxID=1851511 RepID=A0ACC2WXB3_9TREE|nr:hypothetical protein QFC24_007045 [Naganishia onofrii]
MHSGERLDSHKRREYTRVVLAFANSIIPLLERQSNQVDPALKGPIARIVQYYRGLLAHHLHWQKGMKVSLRIMNCLFPDAAEADLEAFEEITKSLVETAATGEEFVVKSSEAPALRERVESLAEAFNQEEGSDDQYIVLELKSKDEPKRKGSIHAEKPDVSTGTLGTEAGSESDLSLGRRGPFSTSIGDFISKLEVASTDVTIGFTQASVLLEDLTKMRHALEARVMRVKAAAATAEHKAATSAAYRQEYKRLKGKGASFQNSQQTPTPSSLSSYNGPSINAEIDSRAPGLSSKSPTPEGFESHLFDEQMEALEDFGN